MLDRFLAFFRDGNAAAVTQGKVFPTPGDASGIGDRTAQGAAASDAPNSFGGVRLLPPEHAATGAAAPFEALASFGGGSKLHSADTVTGAAAPLNAPTPDLFLSNSSGVSASEGFLGEIGTLRVSREVAKADLALARKRGATREIKACTDTLRDVTTRLLRAEVRAGYAAPLSE